MSAKKAASKQVDLRAIESSLTALGGKLTGAVALKPGNILIRLTDTGEECRVTGKGRNIKMAQSATAGTPVVEIAGPSSVIKAVMDGTKEASRAFIAGGLQVRGDLTYLEALLKDMGLLECGG
jgi:hypothetical protein